MSHIFQTLEKAWMACPGLLPRAHPGWEKVPFWSCLLATESEFLFSQERVTFISVPRDHGSPPTNKRVSLKKPCSRFLHLLKLSCHPWGSPMDNSISESSSWRPHLGSRCHPWLLRSLYVLIAVFPPTEASTLPGAAKSGTSWQPHGRLSSPFPTSHGSLWYSL